LELLAGLQADGETLGDHALARFIHWGPTIREALICSSGVWVDNGSVSKIAVARKSGSIYQVTVEEADGRTIYDVTVSDQHVARYAPGATPELLLEASFESLLEREPKEAILTRFELPVIERYFPE
jgi:hypothetical protein